MVQFNMVGKPLDSEMESIECSRCKGHGSVNVLIQRCKACNAKLEYDTIKDDGSYNAVVVPTQRAFLLGLTGQGPYCWICFSAVDDQWHEHRKLCSKSSTKRLEEWIALGPDYDSRIKAAKELWKTQ